ncbi:MAG: nucleoside-diphosphate kinase [Silvanigrellales bacterium]|jgi:nucleoside-diphosphate kinase|nr:nucleoside-diphosphate kinase [Silvanigrellales bacterium]
MELTLSIIKPDGVRRNLVGKIFSQIEESGLRIAATRMIHLSRREAEQFYAVHKERPFYGELVESMTTGPVVVSVLEGANAIARYRDLMGATDPKKAAAGTIRATHAVSIGENTVHGSDAVDTAKHEVGFFFAGTEIVNRAK